VIRIKDYSRKGGAAIEIGAVVTVILFSILSFVAVSDTGPLNVVNDGDDCWRPVPDTGNNSFSSEEEIRDYASQQNIEIPSNISFKTINGTLYQECQSIGGNGE
jgi:hypothetical protein